AARTRPRRGGHLTTALNNSFRLSLVGLARLGRLARCLAAPPAAGGASAPGPGGRPGKARLATAAARAMLANWPCSAPGALRRRVTELTSCNEFLYYPTGKSEGRGSVHRARLSVTEIGAPNP